MMGLALCISIIAVICNTVYVIYKIRKKSKKNRYCGLLVVSIVFALFAVFFGGVWFFFGKELTPQGHWLWLILERGSLDTIETVAEVLGISNILFGWIYTERNKLILGKSQLELIQYQFGKIYTWSVAVHFFATALCLLLTKAGAREGAFFSFLALSGGCVPQVMICFEIGLNPKNREECSIELWENERCAPEDYAAPAVIEEMIRCLSDPSVYVNESYRNVLFKKLADWLGDFPEVCESGQLSLDKMSSDIRVISYELHTLLETVPKSEQGHFSEELFRAICKYLETRGTADAYFRLELLCCGYVHSIYNINTADGTVGEMERKVDILASHISNLTYYFQNQGAASSYVSQFFRRLLGGLEWYLFLTQRVQAPRYSVYQNGPETHVNDIFIALVCSVFDLDEQNTRERNAKIAWDQV